MQNQSLVQHLLRSVFPTGLMQRFQPCSLDLTAVRSYSYRALSGQDICSFHARNTVEIILVHREGENFTLNLEPVASKLPERARSTTSIGHLTGLEEILHGKSICKVKMPPSVLRKAAPSYITTPDRDRANAPVNSTAHRPP